MGKPQLDLADQFYTITDAHLRGYLIKFADQIDEQHRQEIMRAYSDPELASLYRGMRTFNALNDKGFTKKKTMREVIRIPAGPVYYFLKAMFEPYYGPDWLKNKKVLKHELLKPWYVVNSL